MPGDDLNAADLARYLEERGKLSKPWMLQPPTTVPSSPPSEPSSTICRAPKAALGASIAGTLPPYQPSLDWRVAPLAVGLAIKKEQRQRNVHGAPSLRGDL